MSFRTRSVACQLYVLHIGLLSLPCMVTDSSGYLLLSKGGSNCNQSRVRFRGSIPMTREAYAHQRLIARGARGVELPKWKRYQNFRAFLQTLESVSQFVKCISCRLKYSDDDSGIKSFLETITHEDEHPVTCSHYERCVVHLVVYDYFPRTFSLPLNNLPL